MDLAQAVDQIRLHSDALRAAAVEAGPDAAVPTCPEWTVHQLVSHVARAQSWPGANQTAAVGRPPEDWDELLAWWNPESFCDTLLAAQTTWPPTTLRWWARRSAHEAAIHRLDAEHARGMPVPPLLFDPAFAADGVDELLSLIAPRRCTVAAPAQILLHAADAGRVWNLLLAPDHGIELGPDNDPALDVDAAVVGTADAIYRALWRRPSAAIITGDQLLLNQLKAP
ncbi:TIGR03083 family protein [Actinokineospora alba]|uniref:TIGR03083 family protein n=1 Tax=Actinokineospora alba TaxID=504798 RepID=A0A1H0PC86_9PSEU|nr:maleylpyruvate isomerase N-terminal domain-containing protein [Actinokineospora alba]TDP65717.1 uncharacterized protein (TIGR03083 family) [Actinokineospora alba]SDI66748.1 TIGR03083 family protein [Actinokineospora alba]SDP02226.1 TIGR03083 family protein [Actinokineospora alba]